MSNGSRNWKRHRSRRYDLLQLHIVRGTDGPSRAAPNFLPSRATPATIVATQMIHRRRSRLSRTVLPMAANHKG